MGAGDHVVDLLTGYQFTVNHGPTITEIDGTTIAPSSSISISMGENTSQTVDVTIADIETNATELVLTASSSNVALLPASGITLAGSGSARTVTFQPLANKNSNKDGSLSITLTVSGGITADDFDHTFVLTVTADNHAPVVGGVVGTSLAYTENETATVISGAISLSDDDDTQLDEAKVSISNSSLVSGDHGDNGVLTLNGRASLGLYQAVLRTVTYHRA